MKNWINFKIWSKQIYYNLLETTKFNKKKRILKILINYVCKCVNVSKKKYTVGDRIFYFDFLWKFHSTILWKVKTNLKKDMRNNFGNFEFLFFDLFIFLTTILCKQSINILKLPDSDFCVKSETINLSNSFICVTYDIRNVFIENWSTLWKYFTKMRMGRILGISVLWHSIFGPKFYLNSFYKHNSVIPLAYCCRCSSVQLWKSITVFKKGEKGSCCLAFSHWSFINFRIYI